MHGRQYVEGELQRCEECRESAGLIAIPEAESVQLAK